MTTIRDYFRMTALIIGFTLTSIISPCAVQPNAVFTLHVIWKRCSNNRLARRPALRVVLTLSLQSRRGLWSQWFVLTKPPVRESVGQGRREQPSTAFSALSPQEGSLHLMDPHTGFLWTLRSFSQENVLNFIIWNRVVSDRWPCFASAFLFKLYVWDFCLLLFCVHIMWRIPKYIKHIRPCEKISEVRYFLTQNYIASWWSIQIDSVVLCVIGVSIRCQPKTNISFTTTLIAYVKENDKSKRSSLNSDPGTLRVTTMTLAPQMRLIVHHFLIQK